MSEGVAVAGEAGRGRLPRLVPLGDAALLVRFGERLDAEVNAAAVAAAVQLETARPPGVVEIVPTLVSVLLRYDPAVTGFAALSGEVRLVLGRPLPAEREGGAEHRIAVRFGGEDGPDLAAAATALALSADAFIAAHNAAPLRVLATGFAPGFVYCGFHGPALELPRRSTVRRSVPAGSVLFATRQTAIAATAIPTGWHVIGRTDFRNFDPDAEPPTRLAPGDLVHFEAAS